MPYEPSGFSLQIFQSRHASHSTETWAEACQRVAQHIANAETGEARNHWRDRFNQVLVDNLLMPGGRIWYGSGRARGQLLNCFVVPSGDSREAWGKTVSDSIIISGTGGGVGVSCSPVRPRGSAIRGTGGTATGSVSLMEIINSAGEVIKAGGGRRTALMLALGLSHGDIVEFLDKKLDLKQLNNANVSVIFDDNPELFFAKVAADEAWPLLHQGKEVGSIPARVLWERIVRNALVGGEPGILNGYLANKMSNIWYVEPLVCTNPCFHPDTRIATDKGLVKIKDLVGATANVVADRRVGKGDTLTDTLGTSVLPAVDVELKQRNAPVFKVTTEHGYTVTATAEHDFITVDGRKKLAELAPGDVLMLPSGEGAFGIKGSYDEGFLLGLYVADGTQTTTQAYIDIWESDFRDSGFILDAVNRVNTTVNTYGYGGRDYGDSVWIAQGDDKKRIGGVRLKRWLASLADNENFGMLKQRVPESVWQGSREFVRGYLQGLFYGDGSLNVGGHDTKETVSWRLAQSNKPLLEDVQRLLTQFAVVSRLYSRREAGAKMMPDGRGGLAEYQLKEQFELIINRPNTISFMNRIGMVGRKLDIVNSALQSRGYECRRPERFITKIIAVEPAGVTDVYCLTQPETNCVISDGIVNGQCGEIWLSPHDCCCLAALVLPRFVNEGREVDWELLKIAVQTGVRFLDDVLSVNTYPLPEIEAKCNQLRRIGLGITGLHHMLLELGLKYNSPSGLEFVDKLMNRIKVWSYEASSDLAAEKGSFPAFEADKFLKSGFSKTLRPSLREKIRTLGMRNCAVNTIAPTGTISMVCETSSGIEPIFAAAYERRYRNGDEIAMEVVVDPMFKRFVQEGRGVKHFVGAHDLDIKDHLEMQRVCQRHVDNAVSKTINLPHDTTMEELSALYVEYLPDLKGVTVYPDGSRENQPLTPLPLDKAIELAEEAVLAEALSDDPCRSGVCDI
jgi:ribonucleoside-diphosphate reductase alpha chain